MGNRAVESKAYLRSHLEVSIDPDRCLRYAAARCCLSGRLYQGQRNSSTHSSTGLASSGVMTVVDTLPDIFRPMESTEYGGRASPRLCLFESQPRGIALLGFNLWYAAATKSGYLPVL